MVYTPSKQSNKITAVLAMIAGILIGFWVAFTFNFAIILCIVIGMGAAVTYTILAGIATLIAQAVRNN